MNKAPLSRENEQNFTGPVESHEDAHGNVYLYRDDADTANAHYAAEAGAWEKAAQPGFEERAKSIQLEAQIETAHDDAAWEDYHRTKEAEDEAAAAADWKAEQELIKQEDETEENEAWEQLDADWDSVHPDNQEEDEDNEDPLEGDVDKSVHPDETSDPGLAWGNHANAARQHGDLTES